MQVQLLGIKVSPGSSTVHNNRCPGIILFPLAPLGYYDEKSWVSGLDDRYTLMVESYLRGVLRPVLGKYVSTSASRILLMSDSQGVLSGLPSITWPGNGTYRLPRLSPNRRYVGIILRMNSSLVNSSHLGRTREYLKMAVRLVRKTARDNR